MHEDLRDQYTLAQEIDRKCRLACGADGKGEERIRKAMLMALVSLDMEGLLVDPRGIAVAKMAANPPTPPPRFEPRCD